MNIFAGITDSLQTDDDLISAANALVGKVAGMPRPISLCEIEPDEEDYLWLSEAAAQLSPYGLSRWLDGTGSRRTALHFDQLNLSYREAAGCLLLLIASESARRNAGEGYLWPAVRGAFPRTVEEVLFVQGHPKREFKDALEAVSRKLRLRHVFGIEGTQNYYLSVYLQLGFTARGLERIPDWLAGIPVSESLAYLLGDGYKGNRLGSATFASLWNALRDFRRNNIRESTARRIVSRSPWVLPDWVDALMEQAVKSRDLRSYEHGAELVEPPPPGFLAEPKLQWVPPAAPTFISSVENLADFDLSGKRYQVKVGDQTVATLVSNEEGGYTSWPELVELPSTSAEFVAVLVDDNGEVSASQLVELWGADDDVTLFDLQCGERLNAYGTVRSPNRDYGLLLSPDLSVEPSDLHFHLIGTGTQRKSLYELPANVAGPVRAVLFDNGTEVGEFWHSETDARVNGGRTEPTWSNQCVTEIWPPGPEWLGRYRRIRVARLDSGTTLQFIRVGALQLDFALDGSGAHLSEEFDISHFISATPPHQINVKLCLMRDNDRVVIDRPCLVNASGIMRMSECGRQVVDPTEKLSVAEARQNAYRVVLPDGWAKPADLALMEGPVFSRRIWSRPRALGELGGYGAPLEIRTPYNAFEDDHTLVITSVVRDSGILAGVKSEIDGSFRISFRHPLEPGIDHQLVFWDVAGFSEITPALQVAECQVNEWHLASTQYSSSVHCVGVAYRGARLGSWWPDEILSVGAASASSAATTASMLKWMHAPIMAPGWLEAVRGFAWKYPAQTLTAWLLDQGLPDGLVHGSIQTELWGAVVREVFSGWKPNADEAARVIFDLGGVDFEQGDSRAFQLLLRESPLLMGRLISAWLETTTDLYPEPLEEKRLLIDQMRFLIADVPTASPNPYLMEQWQLGNMDSEPQPEILTLEQRMFEEREKQRELLETSAEAMGVDTTYIDRIIRNVLGTLDYRSLNYTDRNNVETALNAAPLRELLGLRILARLYAKSKKSNGCPHSGAVQRASNAGRFFTVGICPRHLRTPGCFYHPLSIVLVHRAPKCVKSSLASL